VRRWLDGGDDVDQARRRVASRAPGDRALHRRGALRGYRLVVVDQRGTGGGALRCPALQRSVGSSDLAVPPPAAVTACARALGPDRDAYATADTVADLDALRTALGDHRWTIAGISYGTLVAQRYALAHPSRTRALVLDSVVPQEGAELLERVPIAATTRVLRTVCARAAAEARAGARHAGRCAGDPARDLAAVVVRTPALGPPLLDALTELSIGVPRLGPIPALLHRARAGDLGPLRALLRRIRTEERSPPVAQFSSGLHAATLCVDSPTPWTDGPAASAAARTTAVHDAHTTPTARGQGLLQTCLHWPPTPAPPPPPRGPIRTPALLLAGDEDLSTPLEWARLQASRMPHAHLIIVPGAGHSILSRSRDRHTLPTLRTFLHP
jgi:pimeloyl-ACP methyl ester carboxylesterase